jgi:hypothetical protein
MCVLIFSTAFACNNVGIYYSQLHNTYQIRKIKNLATCFGYIEPSSGQGQNEVLVRSMASFCPWPDDGSLQLKHVAKFLILLI